MNEQIKLFEKQCWDYQSNCLDAKKFAELIVRECAEVSERIGILNGANFEGEMIADAIKEHFGVEE